MAAAAPWVIAAVAAAGTTYQGVESNQQAQHAKGAAKAQETAMADQVKIADSLETDRTKASADAAASSAAVTANVAANKLYAKRRTLTGGSSTPDSSILSDSTGGLAPTISKTLLGA